MISYKAWRMSGLGKKPRWIIEDENGNIINKNPSKEELKDLDKAPYKSKCTDKNYLKGCLMQFYEEKRRVPTEVDLVKNPKYPSYSTYLRVFGGLDNAIREVGLWDKRYNPTNTCHRCLEDGRTIEDSQLYDACREKDKDGKETGKWICANHWRVYWQKYDPSSGNNLIRSVASRRTGNLRTDLGHDMGDKIQELACNMYGYVDLNKKYDNYTTSIDCQDPTTKILYQIRGRRYNSKYGRWDMGHLEGEWQKDYEDMIFFCLDDDSDFVERIYRIPFNKEIKKRRKSASIYKSPSRGVQWYTQYAVKDEDELKKANEIWKEILNEDKKKKEGRKNQLNNSMKGE